MALINPDLIARIATKLGIQGKAVYPRITKIVNETALERHLAALVLGMRQGVNINKYSTTSERERRSAASSVNETVTTTATNRESEWPSGPSDVLRPGPGSRNGRRRAHRFSWCMAEMSRFGRACSNSCGRWAFIRWNGTTR